MFLGVRFCVVLPGTLIENSPREGTKLESRISGMCCRGYDFAGVRLNPCSPPGQSCVVPPWSAPKPFELMGAIEKIKISDLC